MIYQANQKYNFLGMIIISYFLRDVELENKLLSTTFQNKIYNRKKYLYNVIVYFCLKFCAALYYILTCKYLAAHGPWSYQIKEVINLYNNYLLKYFEIRFEFVRGNR